MIVPEGYSLGQTATVPAQPLVAAKPSSWVDTLTKGIEILGKGAEVYSTYKLSKVKPPPSPPPTPYYPQQPIAPTTPGMDTKTILLIGGGAVAVLGLVFLLTRK